MVSSIGANAQSFRIIENVWRTLGELTEKTKIQAGELAKHCTEASQKSPQKGLRKTPTKHCTEASQNRQCRRLRAPSDRHLFQTLLHPQTAAEKI